MKIAIVGGGGGVGSSMAFNLLRCGRDFDLVLVDRREEMALSHVLDLEQVLALGGRGTVRVGGQGDIVGADMVAITAGAPFLPDNTSRDVYLKANATIIRQVLAPIDPEWNGIIIVATNPVDPLVSLAQAVTGIDRHRVLGYSLNDSLRLRTGIAQAVGRDPADVAAWVLGEHGDGCVPLFDRASIAGRPLDLTQSQRDAAEQFLRSWYRRHVSLNSGRTSTWTSGLGLTQMACAVANGGEEPWPASIILDGEYGLHDVALSVPVTLGPDGAELIHEWPLRPSELDAIHRAAQEVRGVTAAIMVAAQ